MDLIGANVYLNGQNESANNIRFYGIRITFFVG